MIEKIRSVNQSDLHKLKDVVDSCQLFPLEYLEGMIADYFTNEATEDIWFTYVENETPIAIGYCVPEKLTVGTYNLLAIGVSKEFQKKGVAREMMKYIEDLLRKSGGRILIVETSSDEAQMAARNFYQKLEYSCEGVLKDFWKDGEDKIIFLKKL